MGMEKRVKMVTFKTTLPATLVSDIREVKEAVELAGYEFSLATEISEALAEMRRQLEAETRNPPAESDQSAGRSPE